MAEKQTSKEQALDIWATWYGRGKDDFCTAVAAALDAAKAEARAEERERCAEIALAHGGLHPVEAFSAARDCAEQITGDIRAQASPEPAASSTSPSQAGVSLMPTQGSLEAALSPATAEIARLREDLAVADDISGDVLAALVAWRKRKAGRTT